MQHAVRLLSKAHWCGKWDLRGALPHSENENSLTTPTLGHTPSTYVSMILGDLNRAPVLATPAISCRSGRGPVHGTSRTRWHSELSITHRGLWTNQHTL